MTPTEALEEAVATLQSVIDSGPIDDDALRRPTPCSDFDVEQLGDHIIETHQFLIRGAGGDPSAPDGSLSERHAVLGAKSVAQWSRRGLDGVIDLGGNELPAAMGLSLHTLEAYIHAWDLARALDRPFEPSAELTEQMRAFAESFISDDVRGDFDGAPYGAAVVADDTDAVAWIIAHSGRDPQRIPA